LKRSSNGRWRNRLSTRNKKHFNTIWSTYRSRSHWSLHSWYVVSTKRGNNSISMISCIILIRVRMTHTRLPLPKSVGLVLLRNSNYYGMNLRLRPVTMRSYYETLSQSIPIAVKLTWSSYLIFYSFFPPSFRIQGIRLLGHLISLRVEFNNEIGTNRIKIQSKSYKHRIRCK